MTGREVMKELRTAGTNDRCFIKWWRRENDFVDYELVDTFLEDLTPDHEFAGFELLTAEQMWEELQRRAPGRVARIRREGHPVIRWQHVTADGAAREDTCSFEPRSIMAIFDEETRGDTMA